MRQFIFCIVFLLLTGCSEKITGGATTTVDQSLTQKSTESKKKEFTLDLNYKNVSNLATSQTNKTLTDFISACPDLALVASDIAEMEFSGPDEGHSEDKLRGWTRKYQLKFKIADRPKSQDLIDVLAMGHTCFYDFGGGHSPGFVPAKTPCARICKMSGITYKYVDGMRDLDDPASNEYQVRKANLEKEFRANLALEEKAAMRNDYQAQRNLAYVYSRDSFKREDRVTGCAWRAHILNTQVQADNGDMSNLKIECGALTNEERELAMAKSTALLNTIKRK